MERTSSAKLDEMLSFQKPTSDKTGLGYEFSSSNIASFNEIFLVSPANDNDAENNEAKTEISNENLDKGKSILGAPLRLKRKRQETLGMRRIIVKSLNQRSRISVVTVKLQDILVQIAISG